MINYNNKPSQNSRDSRDALVAQFEKEMLRQDLNAKLDGIKLKVRNKMKNEVMSGECFSYLNIIGWFFPDIIKILIESFVLSISSENFIF